MSIKQMQDLARATIEYISKVIEPDMALSDVKKLCEEYMLDNGADSFWYWGIGAFVFSNKNTAVSISGYDYSVSDSVVQFDDIITIDLSPQINNNWGDYARTIIIENGIVVKEIEFIKNDEWRNGLITENFLHEEMKRFVTVETTFEELYHYANGIIAEKGYVNLDFLGNLGHSIENEKQHRKYIEKGNRMRLSDVKAFTFEPHIAVPNSQFGFKKENIYSFVDDVLTEI